jgi:hypothetical protein
MISASAQPLLLSSLRFFLRSAPMDAEKPFPWCVQERCEVLPDRSSALLAH